MTQLPRVASTLAIYRDRLFPAYGHNRVPWVFGHIFEAQDSWHEEVDWRWDARKLDPPQRATVAFQAHEEEAPPPQLKFLAGATSGLVCVLTGQPGEVVKRELQSNPIMSLGKGMRAIYQRGGVPRFWDGLASTGTLAVVSAAVKFTAYGEITDRLSTRIDDPHQRAAIAGLTLGVLEGTCYAGVIERTNQISQVWGTKNLPRVVGRLYAEGGARSLVHGTGATVARMGVWDLVFFYLRSLLSEGKELGYLQIPVNILCGILATLCNCPFDVFKTMLQVQEPGREKSYRETARLLRAEVQQYGWSRLWKGVVPKAASLGWRYGFGIWLFEQILEWLIDEKNLPEEDPLDERLGEGPSRRARRDHPDHC